ncbi:glucose-methanol-choline oxidoreductase-like protein [Lophiotrema nucula]|uniref:Glucose-methanol-choline oxidoreductase-like protein n=1 Tax=Lophiotrema nucula TaxID=690887 RepID=A0A6A5YL87_9PLEO|nr:glucose-methanol-choline oxidoreductase-like protein [Lophiotrema nucula]
MASNTYDFVIVGGGTAGLVLANRLSEDDSVQVLVLEAGGDRTSDPRVSTPALFGTLLGTEVDWNTAVEPQEGLNGKKFNLPYGKILGGSSAINGQAFVATSKAHIDNWGELGNPGWNWDTLSPYFKKAHTLHLPEDPEVRDHLAVSYIDPAISGTQGPIQVGFPDASVLENPLPKVWLDTLDNLGHHVSGDPFSGNVTGAYTNAASIGEGERSYSATAHWEPVKNRPNLHTITGAEVQKILFDSSSSDVLAIGAQYTKEEQTYTVYASKEVILSAGALHSPKILELSGIGSPALLEQFGIPVIIANENVGENLQDQPMTGFSFEVREGIKTFDVLQRKDPVAIKAAMEAYAASKTGPLSVGGIFSHAMLPLVKYQLEEGELDRLLRAPYNDDHALRPYHTDFVKKLLQDDSEATAGFFTYVAQGVFAFGGSGSEMMTGNLLPQNFWTIAACLLHPLSRGYVHVQSADPSAPVRIDPRYLTHPLDLEVFTQHIRYIATIAETEPLKGMLKTDGKLSEGAPQDLEDENAVKEYIKMATTSSWHPTSTCPMLPREKGGVLNDRLVVYGTRNLRVVDARVFPITPRGNPMASVYAVAERAADIIKEDHAIKFDGKVV